MTWLEDGDNVYTASETEKILTGLKLHYVVSSPVL